MLQGAPEYLCRNRRNQAPSAALAPKTNEVQARFRSPFLTSAEAVSCQGPEMSSALDRLVLGLQAGSSPSLLWSEPWTAAPASTGMLREATSHKVPSAALCSAAAGCTRQILGGGNRSQSSSCPKRESFLGRSLSARSRGRTLRSSAQRPASAPRRQPGSVPLPLSV